MKRILIALLIAIFSVACTKVEKGPTVVESGYFSDSYYYSDNQLILLECSIDTFLEGESMVQVWIRNRVWDTQKEEFTLEVEIGTEMTTFNFKRELEKVNRRSRSGVTTDFAIQYRGLEITWNMFDRIYSKYEQIY